MSAESEVTTTCGAQHPTMAYRCNLPAEPHAAHQYLLEGGSVAIWRAASPVAASSESVPEVPKYDFYESMDATLWAAAFVERARKDPEFATDEGTMIAWFANAIMRGYDNACAVSSFPSATPNVGVTGSSLGVAAPSVPDETPTADNALRCNDCGDEISLARDGFTHCAKCRSDHDRQHEANVIEDHAVMCERIADDIDAEERAETPYAPSSIPASLRDVAKMVRSLKPALPPQETATSDEMSAAVHQAISAARLLESHAYEFGMHEMGYSPVDALTGEISRLFASLRFERARADKAERRAWDMPKVTRGDDWGTPVRFACDDATTGDQLDLVIRRGGNGDWYVAVVPKGHRAMRGVRISTSGGASFTTPGLTAAICDAYDAIYAAMRAASLPSSDSRGVSNNG